jgi:hypothetical protein
MFQFLAIMDAGISDYVGTDQLVFTVGVDRFL